MTTALTIRDRDTVDGIADAHLAGFFVDWPTPPSPETHLRILAGSDHVVLARLQHLYMVDLLRDLDVRPFYARVGMSPAGGMGVRRYDRQLGVPEPAP